MVKMYYDKDANWEMLNGKTIAIIGYGSQGHAHALNLKESGAKVIVGLYEGSKSWAKAEAAGLTVMTAADAAKAADVVMMLIPDEKQAATYKKDIAPKGPGHLVRRVFTEGAGVPCLVAVHQDASGKAYDIALAYAKGIGGTRAGVLDTTFREETETDLFGEQAVLCGGVTALITAGYETLVEAGYKPESAYFECMHEMKLIVDLMYEGGMAKMRHSISDTAEYGDYVTGKRIITDETKAAMKQVLAEIQDGTFAKNWILENQANRPAFNAMRRKGAEHPIEEVGKNLRGMMSWMKK